MLADVPSDATDDNLYVSALLRDVIPPAFVRLDDPDNESVVTKVMRLETDVNKIKLLVSLGRVARQDDFTADDLGSMEGALDTLNELDDNENIDQYIEAKLL
ncbi:unknown [Haloarcula marismortui ATCC 43049]|nr:unknown [Haloarcula marismortui ATCC 43049]